jgi:2-C-methyl-D-erythritol 2,4-cyclodiphosphate synthase
VITVSYTPVRIGYGHDIHRLFPGSPLVLGGVNIQAEAGFNTHSDGDVLCHAIIDAMAGAMADGDLGTHYPEDDPDAADARSLDFVREFGAYVRNKGFKVVNLDAFITLGTTRLRPHVEQMRVNISEALGVDPSLISVKARSNDGIGPEGEGWAASASAAVLLQVTDMP